MLLIDSTNNQLREFAGMISREFFFASCIDESSFHANKKELLSSNKGLKVLTKQEFIDKNLLQKFKIC
jgi:hypothetical protein